MSVRIIAMESSERYKFELVMSYMGQETVVEQGNFITFVISVSTGDGFQGYTNTNTKE